MLTHFRYGQIREEAAVTWSNNGPVSRPSDQPQLLLLRPRAGTTRRISGAILRRRGSVLRPSRHVTCGLRHPAPSDD